MPPARRRRRRPSRSTRVFLPPMPAPEPIAAPPRAYRAQMKDVDEMDYAAAARTSTIKTLWTSILVMVTVVALIFAYRYWRDSSGTGTTEKYVGNVGSQGTYTSIQKHGSKKLLQCYQDADCPDETRCNEKGICIPIIHPLPRDFHQMKLGRGRENEKPSNN